MTELLDRDTGPDGGEVRAADAFGVLGLPLIPDLSDGDVRRAYLARLRAVHPDAGGDTAAAQAVTAAYEALRSGVRRGELLAAAMTERIDPGPGPGGGGGRGPRPGRPRPRRGGADAPAPDEAARAALRAEVATGRAAQGLPPQITDPATLARIAVLVAAMEPGAAARRVPGVAGAAWRDAGGGGHIPGQPSSWRMAGRRRFVAEQEAERVRVAAAVAAAGPSRWRRGWARVRYGRPGWLAARVVLAGAVVVAAQVAAPGDPAVPALGVGAVTWLVLAGRLDIAPGTRRR